MIPDNWLLLVLAGVLAGLLAGLLGIGGGTILVPILVNLGYSPLQSVATSSVAILMTSLAGSLQNWRMGYLDLNRVIYLGIPSIFTATLGAYLANLFPPYILLGSFGVFLIVNILLSNLPQLLDRQIPEEKKQPVLNPFLARLATGGAAGLMAGLFGIGGGVIMVPLQILWLGEKIKTAIQTSLGVIVITGLSACVAHAYRGNVLFIVGLILGAGGVIGSQISTRYLPKLSDKVIKFCFYGLLTLLSINVFWEAWQTYLTAKGA